MRAGARSPEKAALGERMASELAKIGMRNTKTLKMSKIISANIISLKFKLQWQAAFGPA